jgi:osmoprotectant transport system permease protein
VSLLDFYARNAREALHLLLQHVLLVGASTLVAVAIGVPLGVLLTRRARLVAPLLGVANVFQTIPSLALFGFLIPLPFLGGIGASTAVIALVLYALLPVVRNTYTGIRDIDPAVREAGRGMGMTDGELLRQVELPLALGVVMAGVRIATVIGVGVATIAAAIGAGGLGVYIFRGVAMVNDTLILAGALPAALMALAADFALGWLERRLTPRGVRGDRGVGGGDGGARAGPRDLAGAPARG